MLNEFSGKRFEFKRAGGVYRLRVDTSAKMKSGTGGAKMLIRCGCRRGAAARRASEVEQDEPTTLTVPKLVPARTCQGQGKPAP